MNNRIVYLGFMYRFLHKLFYTTTNIGLGRLSAKMAKEEKPLKFKVYAECQTTKARTGRMILVHHHVDTPVFMPVGTQVYQTLLFALT